MQWKPYPFKKFSVFSCLHFWSPYKGLAAPSWWTLSAPAACPCFQGDDTQWIAQSHPPRCLCEEETRVSEHLLPRHTYQPPAPPWSGQHTVMKSSKWAHQRVQELNDILIYKRTLMTRLFKLKHEWRQFSTHNCEVTMSSNFCTSLIQHGLQYSISRA